MSSDSSPQREEQEPDGPSSSAGYGWEEVEATVTPTDQENLLPPPKPATQENTTKPLCGYLVKQSQKGPLKVWKKRWFFFDEQKCLLFYCNQKNEPAQGKIDVSTATLTYDVENLSKFQFEIMSEGKVISLQASSNETMIYWLTTLQKKRRKFSARKKKVLMDDRREIITASVGGLISNEAIPIHEEDLPDDDDTSLPVPADLEDQNAFDGGGGGGGILGLRSGTSNRKSWIRQLRPPTFGGGGGSPNSPRRSQSSSNIIANSTSAVHTIVEHSPDPPAIGSDFSPDGSSHDLSSDTITPPIRLNRPSSGRNFTNRLSLLVNKGGRFLKLDTCPNCQKAQDTIAYLEKEVSTKQREVRDRDEINDFLRSEIRLGDLRAKVAKEITETPVESNEKKVDVLLQREQTIQELQRLLEEASNDRDTARSRVESLEKEVKELKDSVELYQEALTAKDHVVVDLTNKLFQLEHKGQVPIDPQLPMMPRTSESLELELKKTKEALEAYRHQNRFLSSEIIELNAIRNDELESFKVHQDKYHELEAKHCKVESKYMILLQETQEPKLGNDMGPSSELVSQMLEEALGSEGDGDSSITKERSNSYDNYGFSRTSVGLEKESNINPLAVKARKLDHQARTAESAINENLASWRTKWANHMDTFSGRGLQRSKELKALIRSGIPKDYRNKVWSWLVKDTLKIQYKEGEYERILTDHANQTTVAVNQIELDLLRTLPTNKYYDKPDATGINKLRRVLVAFSWYDPVVGYCQGLNRLAAIALLFLEEEDAFWCLVAIVQHLLPQDYYSRTLLGSQTDQRVLNDLLRTRSLKLSEHLSLCEIDFSLITFNWFHTIYVDNLPVETMLRIWDTFLYEGSKVLFRFALAIFKYNEEAILSATTSIGIFNHLRTMCQDSTDVDKLIQVGFNEVTHLSKRWLDQRRAHHRLQLQAELAELDALRAQSLPQTSSKEEKKLDLISFDSKEDLVSIPDRMMGEGDSASDTEDYTPMSVTAL